MRVGCAHGESAEAGVHIVRGGGGAEDAGGFKEGGGFDEQIADLDVGGFGLGEGEAGGEQERGDVAGVGDKRTFEWL